ncbi:MAG: type II secretion system minor pseudopilin GspK [Gammaproteobacteria bacterium]
MNLRQNGAALITAMLVTAIAAIAAAAMASRQHIDIRRTANVLESEQAGLLAIGVETWAMEILARDRDNNKTDHLEEDWATVLPPIPVEGGAVAGSIEDLQGRFNINNLVDNNGKISNDDVERFRRLLQAVGQKPDLVEAVVDWIDKDEQETFPGGAEDGTYLGAEVAYRTPNTLMSSPSELLLVDGFDLDSYTALLPHVIALPERTTINVNTASAQVLMALVQGLTESEADQLIGDRDYEKVAEFTGHTVLDQRAPPADAISVSSNYFVVKGAVQYGKIELQMISMVNRTDDAKVYPFMRSQGGY